MYLHIKFFSSSVPTLLSHSLYGERGLRPYYLISNAEIMTAPCNHEELPGAAETLEAAPCACQLAANLIIRGQVASPRYDGSGQMTKNSLDPGTPRNWYRK